LHVKQTSGSQAREGIKEGATYAEEFFEPMLLFNVGSGFATISVITITVPLEVDVERLVMNEGAVVVTLPSLFVVVT